MFSLLHWHFIAAPIWLLELAWNVQRMLVRYFSVPTMVRTLVSHWHKDAVPYGGGISSVTLTFAWNMISRGIGLLIRVLVLTLYFSAAVAALMVSIIAIALFFIWPALAAYSFVVSLLQL